MPLLIVVLLVVFRSVVAALIPLAFGALTVLAGRGVLVLLNSVMSIDAISLVVCTMMGLALGVDYSLLIVSRFREELRRARALCGGDPQPRDRRSDHRVRRLHPARGPGALRLRAARIAPPLPRDDGGRGDGAQRPRRRRGAAGPPRPARRAGQRLAVGSPAGTHTRSRVAALASRALRARLRRPADRSPAAAAGCPGARPQHGRPGHRRAAHAPMLRGKSAEADRTHGRAGLGSPLLPRCRHPRRADHDPRAARSAQSRGGGGSPASPASGR